MCCWSSYCGKDLLYCVPKFPVVFSVASLPGVFMKINLLKSHYAEMHSLLGAKWKLLCNYGSCFFLKKYESYQWQLLQDTWWQLGVDHSLDKKELMHIPQSWDKWLRMNWVLWRVSLSKKTKMLELGQMPP